MPDNSEPVAEISEAALELITRDPSKVAGGIRYAAKAIEDCGAAPMGIGMPVQPPN